MTPNKRRAQLQLVKRMQQFPAVMNAAWFVRNYMNGHNEEARLEAIRKMWAVVLEEERKGKDPEALLYTIVDAIASSALGLPWER